MWSQTCASIHVQEPPKSRFLLADIIAFPNAWYSIHVLSRAAALMIGQHAGFTHICIHTGLCLGICFLGLRPAPMAATPRRPEVPHLLNNILEKPSLRNTRTTPANWQHARIPDINDCKPANTTAVSVGVHMYRFRYSCMCLSTHTCTQYSKCMCTHVQFHILMILMDVSVNISISLLAHSQAPLVASASPHVEPDAEVLG